MPTCMIVVDLKVRSLQELGSGAKARLDRMHYTLVEQEIAYNLVPIRRIDARKAPTVRRALCAEDRCDPRTLVAFKQPANHIEPILP